MVSAVASAQLVAATCVKKIEDGSRYSTVYGSVVWDLFRVVDG